MGSAACKVDVGFVKCFNSSEVFPVSIEEKTVHIVLLDRSRYYLISEVDHRSVGQKVREYASLEEIDSHGCKVRAFGGLFWTQAERCRIGAHFVHSVTLGFLAKLPDPAIHIKFEQTKAGRHRFALRYHANTDVGAALPMAVEEPLVVHAIELIARENEWVIVVAAGEPVQVLPDGVRRALDPVGVGSGLFGSQHLDE